MNNIPTYAEYGNVLTDSSKAAILRGTGNFNPPPKWEQTTDRGPSMKNAFKKYNELPLPVDTNVSTSVFFNDPHELGDDLRKRAYTVGSTGLHSEIVPWTKGYKEVQNQYVEWALKAMIPGGIAPNPMLIYFFSTENVNYIQERIKTEVKKHTKYDVNNQSVDELLIIMRNKFIYAYSGWLPNGLGNQLTDRGPKNCSLEDRISRLNKSVIEECVKQVLSGINQYNQYFKDISSLPMPLSNPVYTSMSGSKELSQNIGFNSGLENSISFDSYNQRFNII